MKKLALSCAAVLAANAAFASAPAAPASKDFLTSSKRLFLPMMVKSYGGKCSGDLGGPIAVSAEGMLTAGKFSRDLLGPEVSVEVSHDVVNGKPGPISFDARVFDEFQANLAQDVAEVATLTAGKSKAECSLKRTAKPSGNKRLYLLLGPLVANVTSEMGCMNAGGGMNVTMRKLLLTPAGLSIDGKLTNLVQQDGKEDLSVHYQGLSYSIMPKGERIAISFDTSGKLNEVNFSAGGREMSCMAGLLPKK